MGVEQWIAPKRDSVLLRAPCNDGARVGKQHLKLVPVSRAEADLNLERAGLARAAVGPDRVEDAPAKVMARAAAALEVALAEMD